MHTWIDKFLPIDELKRIKQWQVAHRPGHELEYQAWDLVLTLWVMGAVGWLFVLPLDLLWAVPLCALGSAAPRLYVRWRRSAHQQQRLRCDWIHLVR